MVFFVSRHILHQTLTNCGQRTSCSIYAGQNLVVWDKSVTLNSAFQWWCVTGRGYNQFSEDLIPPRLNGLRRFSWRMGKDSSRRSNSEKNWFCPLLVPTDNFAQNSFLALYDSNRIWWSREAQPFFGIKVAVFLFGLKLLPKLTFLEKLTQNTVMWYFFDGSSFVVRVLSAHSFFSVVLAILCTKKLLTVRGAKSTGNAASGNQ